MVAESMLTNFWFHLCWFGALGSIIILAISVLLSWYCHRKRYGKDYDYDADDYFNHGWSFTIGILFIVILIVSIIALIVNYSNRANFYASEEVEYQNAIAYHDSLIDALNHTDVLDGTGNENFGLYAEVRNYTMQAARLTTAYKNPNYSIWFKHSQYDWSAFPQITIP